MEHRCFLFPGKSSDSFQYTESLDTVRNLSRMMFLLLEASELSGVAFSLVLSYSAKGFLATSPYLANYIGPLLVSLLSSRKAAVEIPGLYVDLVQLLPDS